MKRTKLEKIRLGFIFVLVVTFFLVALTRLVHLQIVHGARYKNIVERQSSGKVAIPAARGLIYDRSGQLLASNVYAPSLYASPSSKKELEAVAGFLDEQFGLKQGTSTKKYNLAVNKFSWIKRLMSDELSRRISQTAPSGLYLRNETKRKYAFGNVGKQILGFTDIDNVGRSGIEQSFDFMLSGEKGWADIRRDGLRNTFRVKEQALVKPVPGESLVLTIDWRMQEIVENELKWAVEKYHAKSAMAAFVKCNTGEILAIAHYDPGETNRDKPFKLRAVTDQFEPGSSFKIFSAAAILESGEINIADLTYCENGSWKIGKRSLSDSEEHAWLNFRSIFELSSNIGLAKNAIKTGGRGIYETALKFGFGKKTDVRLPGESPGSIARAVDWSSESMTASLAIGYGVAVTCLQMAGATAAIANGGTLYKPTIIVGQVDEDGTVVGNALPVAVSKPVLKSTIDTLKSFMRAVVETGTATRANSELINIAGKTGTAWMANLEKGGYYRSKHVASFTGFFPYEDPLVAGVVVLLNPQPVYYGGWTAGPAFKRIVERWGMLNPDRITGSGKFALKKSDKNIKIVEIPNLIGRDVVLAETMAATGGFAFRPDKEKGVVVWQYPPADRLALYGDDILVSVQHRDQQEKVFPNLKGLSIREAAAILSFLGIKYEVNGKGKVVRQWPLAGKTVNRSAVCNVHCG